MIPKKAKSQLRDKNELTQVWSFKGRFADYMRVLYKGETDSFKVIFNEIYSGYAFCALYGLLKGRRHIYDSKTDDPDGSPILAFRWISADKKGPYEYDLLRRLVLMYSKSSDMPFEEKIDRALKFDYSTNDIKDPNFLDKSQYGANSDIIDEYVLGGLELLYEKVSVISSIELMIVFMNETIDEIRSLVTQRRMEHDKSTVE